MYKWVRIAILSLTVLARPVLSTAVVNAPASKSAQDDGQPSSQSRATFEGWMNSTGLSEQFEILRIGLGPHPDPELADDSLIQHLELRFRTRNSNEADEIARFQQFLGKYQAKYSMALPGKLFYEFVHAFALDRQKACVDLHVMESVYSVYVSHQDSSLVVQEGGNRSPSRFSIMIPAIAPQEQFRTHGGKQSAPNPKYVSDAVEKILTTYLVEANQSKAGVKPEITPERDDGYLGLNVRGLKALVTDRYWEWMSIDVEFHNEPGNAKGSDSQWKFSCYLSVKYASSPREKSPTDADSDYPSQVANFRNKLVDQLQRNLEKGIHD
jgi:hypothetical protein